MPGAAKIPLEMLVVFVSAKLLAEIFERLRQPGIVGEILAGILIGPGVLGWVRPDELLSALADLGAIFLLFRVGLDIKSSELMRLGGAAALVAIAGIVVQFLVTWGILTAWDEPPVGAIFAAAATVSTSLGITARVLAAKNLLAATASKIILTAAVIDDILGLLVLAVVSGLTRGGVHIPELAMTALLACGFTVIVAKWGAQAVHRVAPRVENLRLGEARFAFAMSLLFALSATAVYIGIAAIVGAFLAGIALAESTGPRVRDLAHGVTELLVPFFLTGIGLRVNLVAFTEARTLLLATVIVVAAVAAKFIGCGLAASPLGWTDALRVGAGMIPRGEVTMVVAQVGLSFGIIRQNLYTVVVFLAVATTILAPPLLNFTYRGLIKSGRSAEEDFRIG